MLPSPKKILHLFRRRNRIHSRRKAISPRKLHLEFLENRLTPATAGFRTTALGVIQGLAYIDSNNNGVFDAGEVRLPGATIALGGATNLGGPVATSTTTDPSGNFVFFQVQPGTYTLTRISNSTFVDGLSTPGNLGGTRGTNTIS